MNKSESITNIAKALAEFQAEVKNPANSADNPFFKSKYAPLNDILNQNRPLLSKHGLTVIQSPGGDGSVISITTLIMHTSGEWIETDPLILKADKPTAQGAGSCITYGRRYSLSAVLGVSSEDDDDGNHASGNYSGSKPPVQAKTPPPKAKPATGQTAAPPSMGGAEYGKPNETFIADGIGSMCCQDQTCETPTIELPAAVVKFSQSKFNGVYCRKCQAKR